MSQHIAKTTRLTQSRRHTTSTSVRLCTKAFSFCGSEHATVLEVSHLNRHT